MCCLFPIIIASLIYPAIQQNVHSLPCSGSATECNPSQWPPVCLQGEHCIIMGPGHGQCCSLGPPQQPSAGPTYSGGSTTVPNPTAYNIASTNGRRLHSDTDTKHTQTVQTPSQRDSYSRNPDSGAASYRLTNWKTNPEYANVDHGQRFVSPVIQPNQVPYAQTYENQPMTYYHGFTSMPYNGFPYDQPLQYTRFPGSQSFGASVPRSDRAFPGPNKGSMSNFRSGYTSAVLHSPSSAAAQRNPFSPTPVGYATVRATVDQLSAPPTWASMYRNNNERQLHHNTLTQPQGWRSSMVPGSPKLQISTSPFATLAPQQVPIPNNNPQKMSNLFGSGGPYYNPPASSAVPRSGWNQPTDKRASNIPSTMILTQNERKMQNGHYTKPVAKIFGENPMNGQSNVPSNSLNNHPVSQNSWRQYPQTRISNIQVSISQKRNETESNHIQHTQPSMTAGSRSSHGQRNSKPNRQNWFQRPGHRRRVSNIRVSMTRRVTSRQSHQISYTQNRAKSSA